MSGGHGADGVYLFREQYIPVPIFSPGLMLGIVLTDSTRPWPLNYNIYNIYNITFPENIDVENNYRFDISPTSLADNNYFIFAVCSGANVKILAGKLDYELENSRHKLQGISVNGAIISFAELKEIISSLDNIAFSNTAV